MSTDQLQRALQHGEIELKGQFLLGSNYTFLVNVRYEGEVLPAVYKPTRGEQPLWDFEDNTLALRETAAYLVSEALGFGLVPYTVLRGDGPFGAGSLQQYIEYDPSRHYFNFTDEEKELLKPVALFDLLCNNADRKGSHVFFDAARKLWAIDHGLCFHAEDKLRTVIWDFAGEPIPDSLLPPLSRLSAVRADLTPLLSPDEVAALESRAERLRATRRFPLLPEDRRAFPYPPL
ncbi:MAG: SCO1664 family protein [Anaerolineae bacterium CFX3]|nr:SCO1664 family protein [Anaerolineae bacterium CFX3]MCQ3946370.1 SCO1664 family protein [Anaerolineae bacterium]RIK27054.1 MAG: SCO1664 family protein [Anaerolineae bacterium]